MSSIKSHQTGLPREVVLIDHLQEPTRLERIAQIWHAQHTLNHGWEGTQRFLVNGDDSLHQAMEMAACNYVSIAHSWTVGDDHEDEAPGANLVWEKVSDDRWRLMNYGRSTGVILQLQDVWGVRES